MPFKLDFEHTVSPEKLPNKLMARQRRKSDLPTKTCTVCQRPFTWRKKWADCWDEVKYCSERCRKRRNQSTKPQ